jgi:hypothetical protein
MNDIYNTKFIMLLQIEGTLHLALAKLVWLASDKAVLDIGRQNLV